MALTAGVRLGPYEIVSPIGAGGMGEVYRARDTKLGRDVALKVLPASFTNDPERVARFKREAQVLASLNHPHIAQIYGLEEANGTQFLVLELVDGESLDKRIAGGRIPVDEALSIAKQIAEALDAAHEKGIIHRDLKPANIALTTDGQVKVLDFGLAKAVEATNGSIDAMNSPTITSPMMTGVGVILGTAAYMSPEQAKGRAADKRSDVWAFGCVLYEMLAGRRAFNSDDITETLAFIITKEPDWTALPTNTPAPVRTLIRRCTAKDRKERLADIADARLEIAYTMTISIENDSRSEPAQGRKHAAWTSIGFARALAALFLLTSVALAGAVVYLRRPAPPAAVLRFTVAPPAKTAYNLPGAGPPSSVGFNSGTISPDGRWLVLSLVDTTGKLLLWVRPVDSLVAQPLAGTENATLPFWSPDSRWIAFFADAKLKKIAVAGGPPLTVCNAEDAARGGTWNRDGVIVFAPASGPLSRVAAAGGDAIVVTTLQKGETAHRRPSFLPDGRHFLYRVFGSTTGVAVGSLDSEQTKLPLNADSQAIYVSPGYVLFVQQGTLLAQRFDAQKIALIGEPMPVAEHVATDAANGLAAFSASNTGILTYRTGEVVGAGVGGLVSMVWINRQGTELESVGVPTPTRGIDLSPDGTRVAAHHHQLDTGDVWILDLMRGTTSRLTFEGSQDNSAPIWSPDGRRLAFASRRGNTWGLYEKFFDSTSSADDLLIQTGSAAWPTSWSPDNKVLVYTAIDSTNRTAIGVLPLTGDKKPLPLAREPFSEAFGQLSPDGRWLAYQSNETGRFETYVRPFPSGAGKQIISTNGGSLPRWRRDGKELFYLAPSETAYGIFAVDVRADGAAFQAGVPKRLFAVLVSGVGVNNGNGGIPFDPYAVSADGQRFLISRPYTNNPVQASEPITLVANWDEDVKARVASK